MTGRQPRSERGQLIGSEAQFVELIQRNPAVTEILARLDELELPDAWLVSGCLFQTVWNVLAGEHAMRAIKDYDVFYFDAKDLSAEAEECINRRAAEIFADLGCDVDVRNQARVHIWYESEFGIAGYPRLHRSTDGIDNFLAVCCMVGLKRTEFEGLSLYAPFGTDDVLNCIMRQNPWYPNLPRDCYAMKAERWTRLWPALRVEPCATARRIS